MAFEVIVVNPLLQVSGDKPVFVDSVKPNGAAHKAGLVASDMILEVSGCCCRSEALLLSITNSSAISGQWKPGALLHAHGCGQVDQRYATTQDN